MRSCHRLERPGWETQEAAARLFKSTARSLHPFWASRAGFRCVSVTVFLWVWQDMPSPGILPHSLSKVRQRDDAEGPRRIRLPQHRPRGPGTCPGARVAPLGLTQVRCRCGSRPLLFGLGEACVPLERNVDSGLLLADCSTRISVPAPPSKEHEKCDFPKEPRAGDLYLLPRTHLSRELGRVCVCACTCACVHACHAV